MDLKLNDDRDKASIIRCGVVGSLIPICAIELLIDCDAGLEMAL